jgi:Sulfotransferase family
VALPNFLCIGAQKAGTSWLDRMIRQHPDVWMPPLKELQFFNHLFVDSDRKWTEWAIRNDVRQKILSHVDSNRGHQVDFNYLQYLIDMGSREVFTESWYRRIFERPGAQGKLVGEITPGYCTIPVEGMRFLYRTMRSVRIIYIIREPLERTLSHLRMEATPPRRNPPLPSSKNEWVEFAERREVERRSDYAKFVPLWQDTVPATQLLFLPFGEIAVAPARFLRRIEEFIGLRPYGAYKGLQEKVHETAPVEIPRGVVECFSKRMERQRQFLRDAFGAEFLLKSATKRT